MKRSGLKKKLKNLKKNGLEKLFYHTYYNSSINENLIYIESMGGKDFSSNILRIVEELSSGDYGNYKIYVYAREKVKSRIKELQKNYNLKIDNISSKPSLSLAVMEKAKYIITDCELNSRYIKRDGQIIINTLNGSPLKKIGVDFEKKEHEIGPLQNTLVNSDYLIFPNEYAKDKTLNSYMLEKIFPGKILIEDSPRNMAFFNKDSDLKSKIKFENYQIFAYMPSFRDIIIENKPTTDRNKIKNFTKKQKKQHKKVKKEYKKIFNAKKEELEEILLENLSLVDGNLKENQVLFFKQHPNDSRKIDISKFKHIKPFPKDYDVYDILNISDCLISDYSSVVFDYLNTGKKIILFNYDEEEYDEIRGTYFGLEELPFVKTQSVDELIKELNLDKNYEDDGIKNQLCKYNKFESAKNICKHIFNKENVCKEERIENNAKNVLIFAGGLLNNGITSSLLNLLSNIDRNENNYFISFRPWDNHIQKNHSEIFKKFPKDIEFFPFPSELNYSKDEREEYEKLLSGKASDKKKIKRMFQRELKKYIGDSLFQNIVDFNGYGIEESLLFNYSDLKNTIFVHSNMIQEMKTRKKQNYYALKEVYSNQNTIAIVSPDLMEPTSEISQREDNIKVVHNLNDYEKIIANSKKEINIDKNTLFVTNNPRGIEGVLQSEGKKFITIGRYSPEKGHERLLKSFDKFCDDYPDTQLIIIGGQGNYYNKTKSFRKDIKHWENVTLIKGISNPMPILKRCDLFILSSFYEGWPIVLMEADTLNLPIFATDINGTQWMKEYGGYIVNNDEDGILQGMYDFMEGKVTNLNIDYKYYNERAIEEFYSILE